MSKDLLSVIEQLVGALEATQQRLEEKCSKKLAAFSGEDVDALTAAQFAIAAGKQALERAQVEADSSVTIHIDQHDKLNCCLRLLEIIAIGDSEDPRKDAEAELVAHGFWNPINHKASALDACQMCGDKPYPGCNSEFQGDKACRFYPQTELTNEKIDEIWMQKIPYGATGAKWRRNIARAILAAARSQPAREPLNKVEIRAIADRIVSNLDGRKQVINLDFEEELVEEIMEEMCATIQDGITKKDAQ